MTSDGAGAKLRSVGWDVTPAGCWEWRASRVVRGGYGQLRHGGKTLRTHRVSYETFVGPIPDGLFVCHRCDNPPCVNPAHLFLGTAADNNQDKARKGRAAFPVMRGESAPAAKLTTAQVLTIRQRLSAGERGVDLALEYGVTKNCISRIKTGRTWTSV